MESFSLSFCPEVNIKCLLCIISDAQEKEESLMSMEIVCIFLFVVHFKLIWVF